MAWCVCLVAQGPEEFAGTPNPRLVEKAAAFYDELDYRKAIPLYLELEKQGSWTALRRLGDSYSHLGDFDLAEHYYAKAVMQPDIVPDYYLKYARILMANGKYGQAWEWLQVYRSSVPAHENHLRYMLGACESYLEGRADTAGYTITHLGFNSAAADFGPAYADDRLLFSSSRASGPGREKDDWTNQTYLDLYEIPLSALDRPEAAVRLSGTVNTLNYHEGPACLNAAGDRLYYTSNNVFRRQATPSKSGEIKLKIYAGDYAGGQVADIRELNFNGNEYSCAHPTLNREETLIIFASDLAGGFGGSDIYYCLWDTVYNRWSKPVNAGEVINGPGNERFPFLSDDGKLYFASDGHAGYGGLDLFMAPVRFGDGGLRFLRMENLGLPINGPLDDFALITRDGGLTGFFSSNRRGGRGSDDIYGFSRKP